MADTEKDTETQETTVPCAEPESSEASATAAGEEDSDSNFGAFSAYETAESSDIKSSSDGEDDSPSAPKTLEENADAAADTAPIMMMSSSSLNENDFFDATSEETVGDADTSEETAVVENVQPETDIFGSVDNTTAATTITDGLTSAVESQGVIIENSTDDSTDPFAAFDAITDNIEGGGENESSYIVDSIQDSNIATAAIGEFEEGTGSNVNDKILAADDDCNDPVADGDSPIGMDELLDNGENTHTESGEKAPSSDGTHQPDFTDNGVSTLESNDPSEMNNTDKADGTFSAFDAFTEIHDAPPTSLTALSANEAISVEGDTFSDDESDKQKDAVTETTAVDTNDDIGQFTAATPLENASDENKDNGDNAAFTSSDGADKVDTEEGEAIPSSEDVVQVIEKSTEAANENPIIQDADLSAKDDDGDDDDFGSFEETIPIQAPQETLAEVIPTETTNDGIEGTLTPMDNASDSTDRVGNFGLASFETPMERAAGNDNYEKDESIAVVDESNDFGNFSNHEIEKDTHVEAAGEGTNAFGDFAASTEENTMSAMKEGVADAGEMADAELSDFGGYSAPPPVEETPVDQETLEKEDTALAEKDATFVNATIESTEDFGIFSAYKEENPTDEVDVALTEKDEVPIEQAANASDDFGDFSAPEEVDTALAETDVALTETDTALAETEVGLTDETIEDPSFGDFDGFSAPPVEEADLVEEDSPMETETDIALAETDTALAETEVAVTNETIEDPSFGDFDGFSSAEEDSPMETDTALTEKDITNTEEVIEDIDDFGNFSAPKPVEVETTEAAETAGADDGLAEEDGAPAEITPQESDDFGDFSTSAPSHVDASSNFADVPTPVEAAVDESDEFGDFGGFSSPALEDGPSTEASKEEGEESFGDFGDFSATAPAVENDSEQVVDFAATASFPDAAVENDSEQVDANDNSESKQSSAPDFGDFGDFSTPVETEATKTEPVVEEPTVEDDDGFGDFGDFEAFEEATPAETTPDKQQSTPDETKATGGEVPNPQLQPSQAISDEDDDEFGDFGDFEESDATQEPAGKSEPIGPVVVLNENVRDIFEKSFQIDPAIDTAKRDSCIGLPFDVPMRTVLVSKTLEYTFRSLHFY